MKTIFDSVVDGLFSGLIIIHLWNTVQAIYNDQNPFSYLIWFWVVMIIWKIVKGLRNQ